MKKILNILLSLTICTGIFAACPCVFAENTSADVSQESVIETNVTWEQIDDVLYINGTGDMVIDFEYITEIPWYGIRNEISKIVVSEGITSIYDSAFADFKLVKEVVLPQSLRKIGPAAFITCTSLESIVLPYKTTYIESGAFCNCSSLKKITIPGSILEISDDAFYNCENVSITGLKGTYTEEFAKKHNIAFDGSMPLPEEILVRVNKNYVDFDQPPVIINDRTLVPMRKIFEAMGITVDWDAATRTVSAARDNISIKMTVDTNIIKQTIDGKTKDITIDVPAQIIGDRTMVPARAIVESFLASVNWDASTRTVIVQD